MDGVTLVGEYYPETDTYGSAIFDGCYIDNTSFRGAKGHLCINLEYLGRDDSFINMGRLGGCDLTGVKIVGSVKCYTGKRDIISKYGTVLLDFSDIRDMENDLHNSIYYNRDGERVMIYPYRSLVKRNGEFVPVDRRCEDNLDINVIYVNDKGTNSDVYKRGGFKKRVLGIFRK